MLATLDLLTKAKRGALLWRRFAQRMRAAGLGRKLAITLTIASLVSVLATYAAITGMPLFDPNHKVVLWLLTLNLVLLLSLGFVIMRLLVKVWAEQRRGLAGARLHVRLVMLFGAIAAAPAIVVTIFSTVFINVTIEGWFSEQTRSAISNSRTVAQAYLYEHQQIIRADIVSMAADLRQEAYTLFNPGSGERLNTALEQELAVRNLSEAVVFNARDGSNNSVFGRSLFSSDLERELPPLLQLEQARQGDVVVITDKQGYRVRALMRLSWLSASTYLYVGRLIDPHVLAAVREAERATSAYRTAEEDRADVQVTFVLAFIVLSLLLLFTAAWVGLMVATQLIRPISALIRASERVRAGDLTTQVEGAGAQDELGWLSRSFNRMISQLDSQRRELVEANRLADERRRFSETVLSGVSAGVIGLDEQGRIHLPNRSASQLLSVDLAANIGAELATIVPELAPLLQTALRRPGLGPEAQVKLTRGKRARILLVRITAEMAADEITNDKPNGKAKNRVLGLVVTFDDITELQVAQRTAAWADVARRIAHEIKNPLTPIQLSAERLKRKYLGEITSDRETFIACTDTIVRQVGDIGRMVDEFSAFARMPAPVMKAEQLATILRETCFLMHTGHPSVKFTLELPEEGVAPVSCDGRQIRQALINLLQNAVDGIEGRAAPPDKDLPDKDLPPGCVILRLSQTSQVTVIEVDDNGKGLPVAERERLTEPYVTTRAKGTGLGLAIVKKIVEDHGGQLSLDDSARGGALVRLTLDLAAPDLVLGAPATDPTNSTDQGDSARGA